MVKQKKNDSKKIQHTSLTVAMYAQKRLFFLNSFYSDIEYSCYYENILRSCQKYATIKICVAEIE